MAANMVVRTNVFSLNAHRNMKNVGLEQQRASNRLSSGYRINTAADDAAGLAISETMRAQIRGLDQASRNAQDAQALILTTEGGMQEITNMLQRVRELLVQASNDTNVEVNRDQISLEINQLAEEIGSMQQRVQFNTRQTLAMGTADVSTLSGPRAALIAATTARIDAADELANERSTLAALTTQAISVLSRLNDVSTEAWNAAVTDWDTENIDALITLIEAVDDDDEPGGWNYASADFGNVISQSALLDLLNDIADARENIDGTDIYGAPASPIEGFLAAYNAARRDEVDAQQAVDSARTALVASTDPAMLHFQIGANSEESLMHDFASINLAIALAQDQVSFVGTAIRGADGEMITTFIDSIQTELDAISMERANLGALQNRLDYTMRSLDISSENLQDAESRVRNADMAREMMRFTKSNVLQQAATAMLAQANQIPNNLLQLLR